RQPYLEQVQADFLRKALAFYQEFADEPGQVPRLRLERAKAQRRMGDIHRKLGEYPQAEAAYARALALFHENVASCPPDAGCRQQLALGYTNRGHLFRDRGQLSEAERDYGRALVVFGELAAELHDKADYVAGLAGSANNAALVLQALERPREAEKLLRQA